jgi:hypothetical protein
MNLNFITVVSIQFNDIVANLLPAQPGGGAK